MTTENQTSILVKTENNSNHANSKLSSKLEERKGNSLKPLSLRPNRSVKKTLSMKPMGLKSR